MNWTTTPPLKTDPGNVFDKIHEHQPTLTWHPPDVLAPHRLGSFMVSVNGRLEWANVYCSCSRSGDTFIYAAYWCIHGDDTPGLGQCLLPFEQQATLEQAIAACEQHYQQQVQSAQPIPTP